MTPLWCHHGAVHDGGGHGKQTQAMAPCITTQVERVEERDTAPESPWERTRSTARRRMPRFCPCAAPRRLRIWLRTGGGDVGDGGLHGRAPPCARRSPPSPMLMHRPPRCSGHRLAERPLQRIGERGDQDAARPRHERRADRTEIVGCRPRSWADVAVSECAPQAARRTGGRELGRSTDSREVRVEMRLERDDGVGIDGRGTIRRPDVRSDRRADLAAACAHVSVIAVGPEVLECAGPGARRPRVVDARRGPLQLRELVADASATLSCCSWSPTTTVGGSVCPQQPRHGGSGREPRIDGQRDGAQPLDRQVGHHPLPAEFLTPRCRRCRPSRTPIAASPSPD